MKIRLYTYGMDFAKKLGTALYPKPSSENIVFFFDVRAIPDLHDQENLTGRTGNDPKVRSAVIESKGRKELATALKGAILTVVKMASSSENDFTTITICIMCDNGTQRSVAMAEHLVGILRENHDVYVRHLQLELLEKQKPTAG